MPKRKFFGEDDFDSWEINDADDPNREENAELREAEKQERKAKALESIEKLLSVSEKYSSVWKKRLADSKSINDEKHGKARDIVSKDTNMDFKNMKYFNGTLWPYQIEGVKWMRTLFLGGINGILADEMGLGKTIQIIALFSYLLGKKIHGAHLVVGPLSTIRNWQNEFKRFSPKYPVVVFHGSAEEREQLKAKILKSYDVDDMRVRPVVITNYHTIIKEKSFLTQLKWKYIVIDEAQSIKNHLSVLSITLHKFVCTNKMLLTGTPLQNNMTELWSLLNFIMPTIFDKVETFSSVFILEDMEDNNMINDVSENNTLVGNIHKVLAPFMLRRLKIDVLSKCVPKKDVLVYCPMSDTQRDIYKSVIKKNVYEIKKIDERANEVVPGSKRRCTLKVNYCRGFGEADGYEFPVEDYCSSEEEEIAHDENEKKYRFNIKFQNPMMMFRKVVGHPYLISMPMVPGTKEMLISEKIVTESGKMLVLDAMLHKLKATGHKVLIFSTLVLMLDLIEDYMLLRGLTYRRLDGKYKVEERQKNIEEFNEDPNILAFLISSRAGGLGINLTGADTVIFFDRDWNPQVDLQAQDRCHRIGQTKPVMIYTLVTKNTIDERVIKCGEMKRRLEKLIIKDRQFKMARDTSDVMADLLKLLESNIMSNVIKPNGYIFSDEELEKLLDRSELYKEMENMKIN